MQLAAPVDAAALLRAVLAAPDDDAPRLVLADAWLASADPVVRARGELVVVQCRLARMAPSDAACDALIERESELLEAHERAFVAELDALADPDGPTKPVRWPSGTMRRGFVERARMSVAWFSAHAHALFARAPIREATLSRATPKRLAVLAHAPELARLARLGLAGDIGPAAFASLVHEGLFDALVELAVGGGAFGDAGATALAKQPWCRRLERLALQGNRIGAAGATALCGALRGGALRAWNLSDNAIEAGALAIAKAELPALAELDVSLARLGAHGAALVDGRLPALARLDLAANRLGNDGARAIAERGRGATALRVLNVGINGIGAAGAVALAEAPWVGALEELALHDNPIGDRAGIRIARSPAIATLAKLRLDDCELGDGSALAFAAIAAERPRLALSMERNAAMTRRGRDALRGAFGDRVRC